MIRTLRRMAVALAVLGLSGAPLAQAWASGAAQERGNKAATKPAKPVSRPAAPAAAKPKPAAPKATAPKPAAANAAKAAAVSRPAPKPATGLAAALQALDAGRVADAQTAAAELRDPVEAKIYRWAEYSLARSGARFEDVAAFIERSPDWPNPEALQRRAEEALDDTVPEETVLRWFGSRRPLTVTGAMRLIEAHMRTGASAPALALIGETARQPWPESAYGAFFVRYASFISEADQDARLDALLWAGRWGDARVQLARVGPARRTVGEARLAYANEQPDAEASFARVPSTLQNDAGLAFERTRWYRRQNMDDAARALMLSAPDLGQPEAWWRERQFLARQSLAAGNYEDAYKLARDHRASAGLVLTESEWLAGWIALRYLNRPDAAAAHFAALSKAAQTPVTVARGAYWQARAAEARGSASAAREAYARAAQHPSTFYGQLAAAQTAPGAALPVEQTPQASAAERQKFERSDVVRATRILDAIDQRNRVKAFIHRLVQTAGTPAEHAMVGELALAIGRTDLAVSAAKRSIQDGILLPRQGWPVIPVASGAPLDPPLILATIRQESAFESDAVSPAGARGLMQLMPATANLVARKIGAVHALPMLTRDPDYNIRLGSAYLSGLLDDFDGSYILALAAYNAGPGRVRQWLRDNGDPRDAGTDAVDWIERIPFSETRNYVQRVMENFQMYRARMGQPVAAQQVAEDLRRGR